ncbi:MAG: hypothetical protein ABIJ08_01135 [Nanoarchaeota archaeon]
MNVKKRGFLNFPLGNKKAALELSINAIVIIIIAVVVLSLALGFVRMIFGGATSKFAALIDDESEPPIPSAASPVTLSRSMVITGVGQSNVIKLSVYNPTNRSWPVVFPNVTCVGSYSINNASIQTNSKAVPQGEYSTFNILFDIKKNAAQPSSDLCQINIDNQTGAASTATNPAMTFESVDFTVRVQK